MIIEKKYITKQYSRLNLKHSLLDNSSKYHYSNFSSYYNNDTYISLNLTKYYKVIIVLSK